jgi:ParB family chromosome partitioning protein
LEKKRKALGKGLGALLPTVENSGLLQKNRNYILCPIEKIRPNRYQPRKIFDHGQLDELIQSIKEKGVIQPLLVRSDGGDGYELIAGERRWRAAQSANLREVPVIIREVSDEESLELAIIENIQRADLNPIEEAEGYKRLIDEFSYTQEVLASKVGKDRATISNYLRILRLPEEVTRDIAEGLISTGHAKSLLSLNDERDLLELKRVIVKKGLSVRATESLVKKMNESPLEKSDKKSRDPDLLNLEERLTSFFGTKTKIKAKDKGGRLEIDFYSPDEFDRILALIGF